MSRRRRTHSLPFIQIMKWMTGTAAWRSLDPTARALYLELRARFNGTNNGHIGLGCREAAEALNVGKNVANRAFDALEERGFIRVGTPSGFNTNGRRATEWLLTELKDDRNNQPATKDFAKWPAKKLPSPAGGTLSPAGGTQRRKSASEKPLRPTSGTQTTISPDFASHGRDTYRSTIPEGGDVEPAMLVASAGRAPPQQGAGQPALGAPCVSPALLARLGKLKRMEAGDA